MNSDTIFENKHHITATTSDSAGVHGKLNCAAFNLFKDAYYNSIPQRNYVPGELIVVFPDKIAPKYNTEKMEALFNGCHVFKLLDDTYSLDFDRNPKIDLEKVSKKIHQYLPDAELVFPNYVEKNVESPHKMAVPKPKTFDLELLYDVRPR